MMSQKYLLGIDISTTGAKALLIDQAGSVISSATTPLTLFTPRPLWSEQDPREWWQGIVQSIRQALAQAGVSGSAVAAIGLTGQMHGSVLLNDLGEYCVRHFYGMITYSSQWRIRSRMGRASDRITGMTPDRIAAPKVLWVQQNRPEYTLRDAISCFPRTIASS
jgi:xylulokinase